MADAPKALKAKLLREKAERCFRLAKEAGRAEDADLLNELGREYLEMARKLEAAVSRAMKGRQPKDDKESS